MRFRAFPDSPGQQVIVIAAIQQANSLSGLERTLTAIGSGRWLWAGRRRSAPLGLWRTAIALPVAGCSSAPTMDLLGSFFPGWMLCAVLGVAAAVIIRQILAVAGINEFVVAPLLTYAGLAVAATLLVWLFWFGH
jgi:hypothetical protein